MTGAGGGGRGYPHVVMHSTLGFSENQAQPREDGPGPALPFVPNTATTRSARRPSAPPPAPHPTPPG